jgi:hypothetical protein
MSVIVRLINSVRWVARVEVRESQKEIVLKNARDQLRDLGVGER